MTAYSRPLLSNAAAAHMYLDILIIASTPCNCVANDTMKLLYMSFSQLPYKQRDNNKKPARILLDIPHGPDYTLAVMCAQPQRNLPIMSLELANSYHIPKSIESG